MRPMGVVKIITNGNVNYQLIDPEVVDGMMNVVIRIGNNRPFMMVDRSESGKCRTPGPGMGTRLAVDRFGAPSMIAPSMIADRIDHVSQTGIAGSQETGIGIITTTTEIALGTETETET